MKRKTLVAVVVSIIMIWNCLFPMLKTFATDDSKKTITLNSELYTAVSNYMKENYSGFSYNDSLRSITAVSSDFSSINKLDLKSSSIDDLTGLETFGNLEWLNLSGNLLSLEGNIEVINSFKDLNYLDLSTNKIDGFQWLEKQDIKTTNFQSQTIEKVKIVNVEAYEEEKELPTYSVQTVDGLLEEVGLESSSLDITTYLTTGLKWDLNADGDLVKIYENDGIKTKVNNSVINYDENGITLYDIYAKKDEGKMYYIKAKVNESKNQYFDSTINLYFIIVDDNEEGIVFKDENFYKSVKKQLSRDENIEDDGKLIYGNAGTDVDVKQASYDTLDEYCKISDVYTFDEFVQLIDVIDNAVKESHDRDWKTNADEIDVNQTIYFKNYSATIGYKCFKISNESSDEIQLKTVSSISIYSSTLYNSAYDSALTLVIDKNVLRNKIKKIIVDNERISDLTGLEKFVGLESEFSAKDNYIDSIDKIIELEENKEKEEQAVKDEIIALVNKLENSKSGFNNEETYNPSAELESLLNKINELTGKLNNLNRELNETTDENEQKVLRSTIDEVEREKAEKEKMAENYTKKIFDIILEINDVWELSNHLGTVVVPELYDLIWNDSTLLDKYDENYDYKPLIKSYLEKLQKIDSDITGMTNWINPIAITGYFDYNTDMTVNDFIKFNQEEIDDLSNKKCYDCLIRIKNMEVGAYSTSRGYIGYIYNSVIVGGANIMEYSNRLLALSKLYLLNTPEMLESIVKFPRLKNIDLSDTNIESISGIEKLTKLNKLNLENDLITSIENIDWSALTNIKILNLSKNPILTIDALKNNLPKLQELYLEYCLLNGIFDFDFIEYYPELTKISFRGNYYTDLSLLLNNYSGGMKKNDFDSLAEYIKANKADGGKGIDFNFAEQKMNVNYGSVNASDGSIIICNLPAIFANLEEMDPYNTSFGVVPGDGTVDEKGKTVSFSSYVSGTNTGKVTVENVREGTNNQTNSSIGLGTTCNISYNVIGSSSSGDIVAPPNTDDKDKPDDEDKNTDNDDKKDDANNEEIKDVSSNIKVDSNDFFIIVSKPGVKVTELEKALDKLGYDINRIDESQNGKIYTTFKVAMAEKNDNPDEKVVDSYTVVVLGDINGDGNINSIDSGYARALRYGTLFDGVEDEEERDYMLEEFMETSNFRAGDLNNTKKIEKEDTRAILFYRAGMIDSFDAYLNK